MPDDKRNGMYLRIAMTIALAMMMFEFFRYGVADFMRLQPGTFLDGLRVSGVRPAPAELAQSRERLLQARMFDPANPVIAEYLGQAAFYGAVLAEDDAHLRQGYFRDALQEYETALRLRPNSGYLWASTMLARYVLLGEHDEGDGHDLRGVTEAMRHAIRLAPWEPGVVEQVVWVGTALYARLPQQDRAIVDQAVARAGQLGLRTPARKDPDRYAASALR